MLTALLIPNICGYFTSREQNQVFLTLGEWL